MQTHPGDVFLNLRSDGASHFARAQATGADIHTHRSAVDDRFDLLDIRFPGTVGTTVRVGNFDAESNFLVADITFCHDKHLLAILYIATIIITDYNENCKCFFNFFAFFHQSAAG